MPQRLTKKAIADAAKELAARDPALAKVWQEHGIPPLLRRPATFATFVHIILEQQVSVESAKSTFDRVSTKCNDQLDPAGILALGESGLRECGFSRQKTRYAFALAEDCQAGRFSIKKLSRMDDESVRSQIVARLGLGNWSADIFLMMALLRPDIFPIGDLALVKGLEQLDETSYSTPQCILDRAETWRPFRSVATRMVWQWYVRSRGRDIL